MNFSGPLMTGSNRYFSTGEQVWRTSPEKLWIKMNEDKMDRLPGKINDDYCKHKHNVFVDFGNRHSSYKSVQKITPQYETEACLPEQPRIALHQGILTNNSPYIHSKPQNEDRCESYSETVPLTIDISNYTNGENEVGDTEEEMAAAVLTSMSLSPALRGFHRERDEIFENAMPIKSGDEPLTPYEENKQNKVQVRRSKHSSTLFQCKWPKCKKILSSSSAITRHVRCTHLGPKHNNDEANSDGEEEFYFIEVEASEDVPTEQSSEELSHVTRITSRRCRSYSDPSVPTEPPVSSTSQRHLDDNFIWPLRHSEGRRGKLRRHYNLKKSRGDGKKCRKVFGMENKHLWCTQCRWKKACVKFVD